MSHFKMAAKKKKKKEKKKKNFRFAKIVAWPKFETTFLKEFFNEIWLKVGKHEYIYTFEVIFEK